jgi:hypothetical protein
MGTILILLVRSCVWDAEDASKILLQVMRRRGYWRKGTGNSNSWGSKEHHKNKETGNKKQRTKAETKKRRTKQKQRLETTKDDEGQQVKFEGSSSELIRLIHR